MKKPLRISRTLLPYQNYFKSPHFAAIN